MKKCLYRKCEKTIPKEKSNNKHCSHWCFSEKRKDEKIQSWLSGEWDGTSKHGLSIGIRTYLIEMSNHACSKCNWSEKNKQTGKVPLEVNHIDGDYKNNSPSNIEILCPNCHSLTENYKALNKNGRGWRAKYSQYNLVKERRTPREKTIQFCSCGSPKSTKSELCFPCHNIRRKKEANSSYPPIDKLISLVE